MSTCVCVPLLIRSQRITGSILHPESDSSHSSRCLLPPALVGLVGRNKASKRVSEREGLSFIRYRELLRGKQASKWIGFPVRTKGIRLPSMNINKEGSREEGIS